MFLISNDPVNEWGFVTKFHCFVPQASNASEKKNGRRRWDCKNITLPLLLLQFCVYKVSSLHKTWVTHKKEKELFGALYDIRHTREMWKKNWCDINYNLRWFTYTTFRKNIDLTCLVKGETTKYTVAVIINIYETETNPLWNATMIKLIHTHTFNHFYNKASALVSCHISKLLIK